MSYIKLDRRLLDWEWADEPLMLALWVRILLEANHKEGTWKGTQFEAGTFPTSLDKLAISAGMTKKQVRICLDKLKTTGEIDIIANNRGMKITVNKWSEYQSKGTPEGTQKDTPKDTSRARPRATLKEIQEDKNIKNIKERENTKEKEVPQELAEALEAFEEMRKKIKRPLTDRARNMLMKKLEGFSKDVATQIRILNQSTMNCWLDIYQLKELRELPKIDTLPVYDTANNTTVSKETEEELLRLMKGGTA